jgi:DNA-binding transcriptional MerR regulator
MSMMPRPNGSAAGHGSAIVVPGEIDPARARMKKAPSAFRTISEVADDLHIPQHVLRFWETKFPQVRPLKRGGGRRYYRPDDILLLKRISDLLYIQGFTIKGVQRLLREGGGRLSEDIPPPKGDERREAAEAGVERDPELPLPELMASPSHAVARSRRSAPPPPSNDGEDEVAMLRRVLAETLAELEALRAMLP